MYHLFIFKLRTVSAIWWLHRLIIHLYANNSTTNVDQALVPVYAVSNIISVLLAYFNQEQLLF